MLSIKLLDDYLIKSQDIKTFKIQLLRDAVPYALTSGCTCTLLIANKDSIVVEEEMAIIDASQGIVEFTLHATIGTGNFDCEFLVSNGNDIHLTFPDSGYTVLKISDCLSDRPIQVITPSEYVKLNERMDGFIGELDEFEQSVTTTIDGFEVTLGTMQTQINNSINTMNSNFVTLKSGIEEQMAEMEELVGTVVDPMKLTLINDNNNFSVGVDNTGTKYDAIESSESTIELNGRTLVNLWRIDSLAKSNLYTIDEGFVTLTAEGTVHKQSFITNIEMFKANTMYTIVTIIKENTLNSGYLSVNDFYGDAGIFEERIDIECGLTGTFVNVLTSKKDISMSEFPLRTQILKDITSGKVTYRCVILEGNYSNVPIEYFEGLQSSKPTEIKSVGKNLFDGEIRHGGFQAATGKEYDSTDRISSKNYIYVKGVNEITFSRTIATNITYFYQFDRNMNLLDTISIKADRYHYTFALRKGTVFLAFADKTNDKTSEIQFEIGTQATQYEPYKENIVTLPNIEPLRSLPNGVCDEVFIHDDKLVVTRNVGLKIVTDETVRAGIHQINDTYISVILKEEGVISSTNNINYPLGESDVLPILKWKHDSDPSLDGSVDNATKPCLWQHTNSSWGIVLALSMLESSDAEGVCEWLKNNNITTTYQLATPTYEWYELPSPHLYKDGHVFVDSGSVPLINTIHNVNLSLRSAIDTNVEEIVQIKEELNTLDLEIATQDDVANMWQGLLKGGNE